MNLLSWEFVAMCLLIMRAYVLKKHLFVKRCYLIILLDEINNEQFLQSFDSIISDSSTDNSRFTEFINQNAILRHQLDIILKKSSHSIEQNHDLSTIKFYRKICQTKWIYFQKLRNFVDFLLIEPVSIVKYASHTYIFNEK